MRFPEVFFFFSFFFKINKMQFKKRKKKSVFHVWSDVCSPNTHANMLKGELLQHVGQQKHVSCTFASLEPSERRCMLPGPTAKLNLPGPARGAESLARSPGRDGWIHRRSCLKYVHTLGVFFVWFPCLSWAEKRSWDKRNFLSLARFIYTLLPQAARFTTAKSH